MLSAIFAATEYDLNQTVSRISKLNKSRLKEGFQEPS